MLIISNLSDLIIEVSNTSSKTMDYGQVIAVSVNIPSGYSFLGIKSAYCDNWTMPISRIDVYESYAEVLFYKLIAGESTVHARATFIFIKSIFTT